MKIMLPIMAFVILMLSCKTTQGSEQLSSESLISTIIGEASITSTSNSEFEIKANLLAGNNDCLAEGVEVLLKVEEKEGASHIVPYRTEAATKRCPRIYRPAYKQVTLKISKLNSVFLDNYKKIGETIAAGDLLEKTE